MHAVSVSMTSCMRVQEGHGMPVCRRPPFSDVQWHILRELRCVGCQLSCRLLLTRMLLPLLLLLLLLLQLGHLVSSLRHTSESAYMAPIAYAAAARQVSKKVFIGGMVPAQAL